jgi:hypothetical protein
MIEATCIDGFSNTKSPSKDDDQMTNLLDYEVHAKLKSNDFPMVSQPTIKLFR